LLQGQLGVGVQIAVQLPQVGDTGSGTEPRCGHEALYPGDTFVRFIKEVSHSAGGLLGDLYDVHELQAERTYPIQDDVQAGLVQVTPQDSHSGLDFDRYVGEPLSGRRAERPTHPDVAAALVTGV